MSRLHNRRKEKEKEKKKEKKLKRKMEKYLYSQALWELCDGTFKSKCPTVKFQKKNKIANYVFFWTLILVISSVLIYDMMSGFDRIVTIQTTSLLQIWIYVMEMVTSFLILVSVIMRAYEGFLEDMIAKLLSW